MYYVQRLNRQEELGKAGHSTDFLDWDHMGSSEFEFGRAAQVIESFRFDSDKGLLKHWIFEAQSKGGKAALVTFHVLCTELAFKVFKDSILRHLDGTTVGRKAKERTELWEKFNGSGKEHGRYPDAWVTFDGCISSFNEGAIFFTTDEQLFWEFKLFIMGKPAREEMDLRIGDVAIIAESKNIDDWKVVGLLEDDIVVLKNYKKKIRKPLSLVYPGIPNGMTAEEANAFYVKLGFQPRVLKHS